MKKKETEFKKYWKILEYYEKENERMIKVIEKQRKKANEEIEKQTNGKYQI